MSVVVQNKMHIRFDANWFKANYYVYVIVVKHNNQSYYYVGQTGDRKYTAARSPFYRLWGHYNPYNSKKGTDSQLIKNLFSKGILKDKNGCSRRQIIDEAIYHKIISIDTHFYPIAVLETTAKNDHLQKRIQTESVEAALINLFDKEYLFNNLEKIGHASMEITTEASEIAQSIYDDVVKK